MNTKKLFLTLFALFAGASSLMPATALAERDNGRDQVRQQESRDEQRDSRQAENPQRAEQQNRQRIEKQAPQRMERQNQPRVEQQRQHPMQNQPQQRVERQNQQRVERQAPQRVEREERREQRPAVVQQRSYEQRNRNMHERRHMESRRTVHIEPPRRIVRPGYYRHVPRSRYFMGIRIHRPYGYLYPGFGFYYSDHDAFRWLAFTALTLTIIDHLDEDQQRMHEQALIRATSAEVGDTLYWDDRHASGSVTVLYIGTDRRGREYREFRQTVSARGRTETSYGSAYLKSNGSWEVMESN